MDNTILELLLGALLAIITTIIIERLRKPKITFSIDKPKENDYLGNPVNLARFLGIKVTNKPLPKLINWWLSKDVAVDCHGYITFFDSNKIKLDIDKLVFRWANSPEPIAMRLIFDNKEGYLLDPMRLKLDSRIDIPPGETEMFGVAARFDDDIECYGWSNENYLMNDNWRDSKRKFSTGEYLFEVTLFYGGNVTKRMFKLVNGKSIKDFSIYEY